MKPILARWVFVVAGVALLAGLPLAAAPSPERLLPVPFTDVDLGNRFWRPRLDTNREATIPHVFQQSENTGRISNFAKASGLIEGNFEGSFFNDSDVYKIIEGAAHSLGTHPDPEWD